MGWNKFLQRLSGPAISADDGSDAEPPRTKVKGSERTSPFIKFLSELELPEDATQSDDWAAEWNYRLAEQIVLFRDQNRRQRPPDPALKPEEIEKRTRQQGEGRRAYEKRIEKLRVKEEEQRANARRQKPKGYLDKLGDDLEVFYKRHVNIAACVAAVIVVLVMALYSDAFVWVTGDSVAPTPLSLLIGSLIGSTVAAASVGLWSFVRWRIKFDKVRLQPRMKEARRRNVARLHNELSVHRKTFLTDAQNEDPDKGPVAFAKMRLLSRLYWDAFYFNEQDYDIFGFITADALENQRWRNRLFRRMGWVSGFAVLPLLELLQHPVTLKTAPHAVVALSNISAVTAAASFAAGMSGTVIFFFARRAAKAMIDRQKAVFRPTLLPSQADDLDISDDRAYELEWPPRHEDDETLDYAVWLKKQFTAYETLKKNPYGRAGLASSLNPSDGSVRLGEPMRSEFDGDRDEN